VEAQAAGIHEIETLAEAAARLAAFHCGIAYIPHDDTARFEDPSEGLGNVLKNLKVPFAAIVVSPEVVVRGRSYTQVYALRGELIHALDAVGVNDGVSVWHAVGG
jgi:hypothetical protein